MDPEKGREGDEDAEGEGEGGARRSVFDLDDELRQLAQAAL